MSNQPQFDLDKAHRWFGIEFNNGIFPLLEKADRTEEETERMIAMAYAAAHHWRSYSQCKPANSARAEYMIATALTFAGRKEQAMHHARQAFHLVFDNINEMSDFDISYAYMAMSRAWALSGEHANAREYYEKCLKSIEEIKDPEDKEIVVKDLNSGPWGELRIKN